MTSGQAVLAQGRHCCPLPSAGDTSGQKATGVTARAMQENLPAALRPQHPPPTHSQIQETPSKNPQANTFRERQMGQQHTLIPCPSSLENSPFPGTPATPLPLQCQLLWLADLGHRDIPPLGQSSIFSARTVGLSLPRKYSPTTQGTTHLG